MKRVLEIDAEHTAGQVEGEEFVTPPRGGAVRWIDVERATEEELQLLLQRFAFHPLAIEDCAHFDQRPKLEKYEDHLFIVTHGFEIDLQAINARSLELHTFLGANYIVTVHEQPIPALNFVWERLLQGPGAAPYEADFIRYLIADAMVDSFFPIVDQIAWRIEEIEENLLDYGSNRATLQEILQLKRQLVSLRKLLPSQRDVLSQLSRRAGGLIRDSTAVYFRDAYDHLLRVSEAVEANRELLGNVLDAYHWTVSQRTNEVVKRLTIVSAVFLPLTFITGFFGQNFEALPFGSEAMLAGMLVSCLVVPAAMVWFFLRSQWF